MPAIPSQERAEAAAARSLQSAGNSIVFAADIPEGEAMMKAYATRLDNLLDEAEERREDVKELKKEMKNAGVNVGFLTKAVMLRRKKAKIESVEYEMRVRELHLYFNAILGTEEVLP